MLRGVALLGILPVNIINFAMPYSYLNPTVFGGDEWENRIVHAVVQVLIEQKAMALFSMLFGASVILLCSKLECQGRRLSLIYFSRNVWLLVFGVVHFVFISISDILCVYAICAFVLYFFRWLRPGWLFFWGIIIFLFPVAVCVNSISTLRGFDADTRAALHEFWQPNNARVEANLELFRGDYARQLASRLGRSERSATRHPNVRLAGVAMHLDSFSRSLGMMFIGMAVYNWGMLTAGFGNRFYRNIALVGVGFGAALAMYGLYQHYAHDWVWDYSMFVGRSFNHIATLFMAIGYTSGVMLWSQSDFATSVRTRLAAVGRMALTNYIGQSVLATTVFYGFGLGWYGYLSRLEQQGIVVGILFLQIVFSSWWLARFDHG